MFFLHFVFIFKKLFLVCEDPESVIKLELKEFGKSWYRDFRKFLSDVRNSRNFISKASDEMKKQLQAILRETEGLKASDTELKTTCKALFEAGYFS